MNFLIFFNLETLVGHSAGKSFISQHSILEPRNLSWTHLSVRFSGSVVPLLILKEWHVAPTRRPHIVILRKAFAVKQMSLKNVQSDV